MTQTQTEAYTIADLLALDDDALNPLAAELRGYSEVFKMGTYSFWQDGDGKRVMESYKWRPATDRNQSGDLLKWATDEAGVCFDVFTQPGGGWVWIVWSEAGKENTEIPFVSARAECVAFCAAMLALQGRLRQ